MTCGVSAAGDLCITSRNTPPNSGKARARGPKQNSLSPGGLVNPTLCNVALRLLALDLFFVCSGTHGDVRCSRCCMILPTRSASTSFCPVYQANAHTTTIASRSTAEHTVCKRLVRPARQVQRCFGPYYRHILRVYGHRSVPVPSPKSPAT